MNAGAAVAGTLALAGLVAEAHAVLNERLMQRHRRPGVTYWAATLRRDGGWRRDDLFDADGLVYQRRAARSGWLGALCWMLALAWWVGYRTLG